jgi:hypothetical protein
LIVRTFFVSLHQRPLISDEREYHYLGRTLATQHVYSYDGTPTAYRPVGYPAFIAAVYSIIESPAAVKYVQVILDCLIILLLYYMVPEWPQRNRLIAAGVWALYPPAILYTNFLMSETLFTFLLVVALFLLTRLNHRSKAALLFAGIILGYLLLLKPHFLLFLLIVGLAYKKLEMEKRQVGLLTIGILVVTLPWLVRNAVQLGTFSLATNGGINLLIGNHPHATGAYALTFPPEAIEGATTEVEVDRLATNYAMKYIFDHPVRFALNAVKKFAHLFSTEGGLLVWSFHPEPESRSASYAEKYSEIPLPLSLLVNVPYICIVLGSIVGLAFFRGSTFWYLTAFLIVSFVLAHIVSFGGSRFHFPLIPFLLLYASMSISVTRDTLKTASRLRLVCIGMVGLVFLLIWIVELSYVLRA